MKYASICSGVEAATLAWEPLGWEAAFFAEIDKFPSAVLKHRWPNVPNLGDFTTITEDDYDGTIELLVGGTPCQGFSIAGLRGGLDDDRSNLALEFLKLTRRTRPRWIVWENVPGVLSSWSGEPEDETIEEWKERNDFDQFCTGVRECGYGFAYRILDAQFTRTPGCFEYAVPQRRRRVFLVGYIGDWRPAAAVLFERDSLQWNPAPERQAGEGVARSITASTGGCSGKEQQVTFIDKKNNPLNPLFTDTLCIESGQAAGSTTPNKNISPALTCLHEAPIICRESGQGFWKKDKVSGVIKNNMAEPTTVICNSIRMRSGCEGGGKGALVGDNLSHTLAKNNDQTVICYENHMQDSRVKELDGAAPQLNAEAGTGGGNLPLVQSCGFLPGQGSRAGSVGFEKEIGPTLRSGCDSYGVLQSSTVRRLTPLECERLMGMPDNHTRIPWRGKAAEHCPDGPRYKACGNSMCVNVMHWLGLRIQMVEDLINKTRVKK